MGGVSWAKVVFKPSHRGECYLLPPSLDELIGNDNLVRFVDAVVDRLELSELIERYTGGGASAYHPATLLRHAGGLSKTAERDNQGYLQGDRRPCNSGRDGAQRRALYRPHKDGGELAPGIALCGARV